MAKFSADTVDDFIAKAAKKWGKGEMGEAHPKSSWTYGGFKNKKIVKLEFKYACTVEYAEAGGGKGDKNEMAAIKEVARLAKKHETTHKERYDEAFKKWGATKQAKDLMEQEFETKADAVTAMEKAYGDLKGVLLEACIELHKKEGYVEVEQAKDGTYDVRVKAAGAKGCE